VPKGDVMAKATVCTQMLTEMPISCIDSVQQGASRVWHQPDANPLMHPLSLAVTFLLYSKAPVVLSALMGSPVMLGTSMAAMMLQSLTTSRQTAVW
jgi:hypothetical protein